MRRPVAVAIRGSIFESRHPFTIATAVAGADGAVVGEDTETPFRSAAKPFQLASSLAALGDPDVPEEELAVGAASHSGEPRHVALVRSVLARFGTHEADLRCGAHPPIHGESANALVRSGEPATDIHNNCSGKHAAMLAVAKHTGSDLASYTAVYHPVQQAILNTVAELAEMPPSDIALAVDGCAAPNFGPPSRTRRRIAR